MTLMWMMHILSNLGVPRQSVSFFLLKNCSSEYPHIYYYICRSSACNNKGILICMCHLCNKYLLQSGFPKRHHDSVQHTKALIARRADNDSVVDDQSMELDEPSNTSIAPLINSVSVESCSSNEDNFAVVMMDDILVMEDVQYFFPIMLWSLMKILTFSQMIHSLLL